MSLRNVAPKKIKVEVIAADHEIDLLAVADDHPKNIRTYLEAPQIDRLPLRIFLELVVQILLDPV